MKFKLIKIVVGLNSYFRNYTGLILVIRKRKFLSKKKKKKFPPVNKINMKGKMENSKIIPAM